MGAEAGVSGAGGVLRASATAWLVLGGFRSLSAHTTLVRLAPGFWVSAVSHARFSSRGARVATKSSELELCIEIELKSLILAQIERWRHALHMQVERQRGGNPGGERRTGE